MLFSERPLHKSHENLTDCEIFPPPGRSVEVAQDVPHKCWGEAGAAEKINDHMCVCGLCAAYHYLRRVVWQTRMNEWKLWFKIQRHHHTHGLQVEWFPNCFPSKRCSHLIIHLSGLLCQFIWWPNKGDAAFCAKSVKFIIPFNCLSGMTQSLVTEWHVWLRYLLDRIL